MAIAGVASAAAIISLISNDIELEGQITGLYLGAGAYVGKDVPVE